MLIHPECVLEIDNRLSSIKDNISPAVSTNIKEYTQFEVSLSVYVVWL